MYQLLSAAAGWHLLCLSTRLHALPLSCVEHNVFGLSEGLEAASRNGLAHAQGLLPGLLSGSCLSRRLTGFLLGLRSGSSVMQLNQDRDRDF